MATDEFFFTQGYEVARRNATENPLAAAYKSACDQRDVAQRKLAEFEEKDWVQAAADEQRRADAAEERASALQQQLTEARAAKDTIVGLLRDATGERQESDAAILVDRLLGKCVAARAAKEAAEASAAVMRERMNRIIFSEACRGEMFFIHGWQKTPETVANALSKDDHEKWVSAIAGTAGQALLSELADLRCLKSEADEARTSLAEATGFDPAHFSLEGFVAEAISELTSLRAKLAEAERERDIARAQMVAVGEKASAELAAALSGEGAKKEGEGRDG